MSSRAVAARGKASKPAPSAKTQGKQFSDHNKSWLKPVQAGAASAGKKRSLFEEEDDDDDEDDEEEEEEEEPEGKWYYLGGNSVGELVLNIIALAIAGVMLFNFLYAKGWWQKFCQPLLDWLLKIAWPFFPLWGSTSSPDGSGGRPTCTTSATCPCSSRT